MVQEMSFNENVYEQPTHNARQTEYWSQKLTLSLWLRWAKNDAKDLPPLTKLSWSAHGYRPMGIFVLKIKASYM